jgi:hypothetical protein
MSYRAGYLEDPTLSAFVGGRFLLGGHTHVILLANKECSDTSVHVGCAWLCKVPRIGQDLWLVPSNLKELIVTMLQK